jgi:hypothetical protein
MPLMDLEGPVGLMKLSAVFVALLLLLIASLLRCERRCFPCALQ